MTAAALKGLAARKLRTLATVLAVLLGVALVAGTYILTDTIDRSFDEIFATALSGTDAIVTPREIVAQEGGSPPAFSESLLDRVEGVRGVERAQGAIFALARIADARGEPLGRGFAPSFVTSKLGEPFDVLDYVAGRPPRGPGEAAIDADTAEREGVEIGDRVGVLAAGPLERYRVVGINRLGETSTGGSASVTLTLEEAQRVTGRSGQLDEIAIAAAPGVEPERLRRRVARALPPSVRVETGVANAARSSREIREELGFLRVALLVFAGISLVVGGFLIFNTFSITVAQRTRELGLLRTLGASRGQLLAVVLGEAVAIGALGAVLGVGAGVGFAVGIDALLESVGVALPTTGLVFQARTAIVAGAVGVGIALLAALVPALRATRVSPMAALREAALPESRRRGRIVAVAAAAIGVVGLGLLLLGLFGDVGSSDTAAGLMGGGSAAILFAASLLSPRLVRPLASVAGWPLEVARGLTGRLARENAVRKPGRTAATAAALMIGLALVVFVTVFAAGLERSIAATIDASFQGDITVQSEDGFSAVPASVAREVDDVDGVEDVASLRFAFARIAGGGRERVAGVDPKAIGAVFDLDFVEGSPRSLRRMEDGETLADASYAETRGLDVGDTLRLLTPTGRRPSLEVVGTVEDPTDLLGSLVVTQEAMESEIGRTRDSFVLVGIAEGADPAAVQRRIGRLLDRRYPAAEALDQQELKRSQADRIGALVGLVYALLSLAVVVSILGIVNTLALSIHERTRELGMLRAIGMTRSQVRWTIRYEAVITALIGALLGTALGVLFAALISRPLAAEGFQLAYPVGQLLAILAFAALAGVVAAIWPARRASRLDVLDALAYE